MNKTSNRRGAPSKIRRVVDHALFGGALLGMLVTAHLFIQQDRGFDRGCLGFSAPTTVVEDCAVVAQSAASTAFGVPNAVWGSLFYAAVAAISAGVLLAHARRQMLLKRARALLVGGGFFYTAYLLYYQAAVIEVFCELCLVSAAIETALLILVAIDLRHLAKRTAPVVRRSEARPARREASVMAGLAVLVFVLVGADFAYYTSLETAGGVDALLLAPAQLAVPGSDDAALLTPVQLAVPGSDEPGQDGVCRYDPEKEPVADYMSLVSPLDPFTGNPVAPVTVIEFFDPNCPHCRTMYHVLKEVSQEHADVAMFVYKPFVIWQFSVIQSAALYAAAQQNRFFEMLEHQFAAEPQPGGLTLERLHALATRIGMDADLMSQRIQSGVYQSVLRQTREQSRQVGITAVPAVMINGRWVDTGAHTAACIAKLIKEAAR